MAHKFFIFIFTLAFALNASAQSGRIKKEETPASTPRPNIVYQPTQKISATPTPEANEDLPEDDGEIIRVASTLVPIPVSVLDETGRAVTDLDLPDFELEVEGKPSEIGGIFKSESPIRLALLFDNSSSVTLAREFEEKAAIRFFKRVLRPEKDLAALYSVAGATLLEQPLTKNTSQLINAIKNFSKPKGATALLDGIIEAANYLEDHNGRRVIVIVSDGDDTLSRLTTTLEKVVRAVQSANCQVYVVQTTEFENYKRTGNRMGSANLRYLDAERRMQELAAQTGGAVYMPIDEKELDQAFEQISAELSSQYILSYYPENDANNSGDFRTVSVKVKDGKNLSVRARKGYYVPRR